jgi:hypothetical protein
MFAGIQTLDRLQRYVIAWVSVNRSWAAKYEGAKYEQRVIRPILSTTKNWKHFFQGFFRKHQDSAGGSQLQDKMLAFMGIADISTINADNCYEKWNNQIISGAISKAVTPDIICEVVWSLHVLNFIMDLVTLDLQSQEDRELASAEFRAFGCFGWSSFEDMFTTNRLGLSDPDWRARTPYVKHLAGMMRCWKRSPFVDRDLDSEVLRCSATMFSRLESEVASFYCERYASVFDRRPVVPALLRRLP